MRNQVRFIYNSMQKYTNVYLEIEDNKGRVHQTKLCFSGELKVSERRLMGYIMDETFNLMNEVLKYDD